MDKRASVWSRLKWIAFTGWVVAGIRFALDFQENDPDVALKVSDDMQWTSEWIGVYYAVPILIIIGSVIGSFRGLNYVGLLKACLFLGVMCWTIPNAIVYPTAQFMEWEHGRFYSEGAEAKAVKTGNLKATTAETLGGERIRRAPRGADVQEGAFAKLGMGLMIAALTTIAGFVWCFVWVNLAVFLPGRHKAAS